MIAYNTTDLDNESVCDQATAAFRHGTIDGETYKKILSSHKSNLYTPHFFIRIGLMILTLVIISFSAGLLGLLFGGFDSITAFFIFMALVCYGSLELMVRKKQYFNAGIDNLLQWSTLFFLLGAVLINNSYEFTLMSLLMFLASAWMAWRFVDALMSLVAYFSMLIFIFLVYVKFGDIAKATAPFALMMVSALIFFLIRRMQHKSSLRYHQFCFDVVMVCTLISFYACGNYFVVKELSNEMFHLQLQLSDPIPFGWLFWILTVTIPVIYIFTGLKKKDRIFLRTGLLLIAITVLTIRYYHEILAIEKAFLLAGIILVAISYACIKFLDTPKAGFTFEEDDTANKDLLQLEALILAETFGKKVEAQPQMEFGGGSGGGGGAGGTF